ncbi:MAG: glycosyltransferase [Gemmatimonadaceae bacterium]|nr:glycosyltransferase [Gemmatimonadaceae bacterium]
MTPRRILVVASTFPASPTDATPRFVRDLVEAMHREDPSRSFAVLAPHVGTETVTYQRHEHFEEFRFGYVWPRGLQRLTKRGIMPAIAAQPWMLGVVPFLFLGEYLAMRRLVRTWKPDVIHAQWFTPQGVVAAMVARATGVPWVLTTHASDVSIWNKLPFFGGGIVRALLPFAQRITAVSTGTLARARGFFDVNEWAMIEPKVRIIPMGAPAIVASAENATGNTVESHTSANRGATRSLLFIGRLAEKKGIPVLLDALSRLDASVRLVIAGTGPEEDALRAQVARLGLTERVEFAGFVTGAAKDALIAAADVVVVPSIVTPSGDAEGLPVVVLEALAAGRLCVATDASGAGDVITDGENGFLVPARDSEALASRLKIVLALDATARERVAARARESMVALQWPLIARRHLEFLFTDLPAPSA